MYYGVDPYLSYAEMPASRNGDKAVAAIRFERHAAKARLVVDTSEHFAEAIQGIAEFRSHTGETIREHQPLPGNTQVDFVYIDGDHSYESTIADMERWWQLLSPHGILAGHDFNCWGGVERAVQEFSRDMRTYLTNDWPNSWYIYKNGIPSNNWVRNDWKPSQFCH
jgi:predicted O-methyltransferase YrrM